MALVLALTFAANKIEASGNNEASKNFVWLLVFLNSSITLLSIIIFFLPQDTFPLLLDSDAGLVNIREISLILFATGLWGILTCWSPFRSFLARFIELDPASPVHLTALVLVGYLVGNTALSLSQDFLQQLNETELSISKFDVLLQQASFALLALTGVGLFFRRDLDDVFYRLGLVKPTLRQLMMGSGVIVMLVLIQAIIGGIWALLNPEQAAQLGSLNDALLAGFDSIGEWFILAIASGIGEETLFRGALQPIFGLPLTSFLFAIVHIQYGLTPITIVVFFLGLILGLVRRFTNTTVAIYVHFGYNFLLGLFTLLALHLDQFAPT